MHEALSAAVVLLLLLASTALGMFVRGRLPARHHSRETVELVGLGITMLVTFASLVMGLLIYSVKGGFDQAEADMATFAGRIVQLDQCLQDYGWEETADVRALLRTYTASVIATTWPHQPKPPSDDYSLPAQPISPGAMESPALGRVINRIGLTIRRLHPANDFERGIAATCLTDFQRLQDARWAVNEEARSTISIPFLAVLVFWLMVIFVTFGLNAPRTAFVFVVMTLCAVSISSAVFVMLDLDTPFSGVVVIRSQPMRNAYADITHREAPAPQAH